MSYSTLSVCFIAKDEEKNLHRCVNSVKNIADELIMVDTGSKDNTINIAKNLGVSVYTTKWNNSFSEAKNFALEKCTKDWVLVIDADEALKDGDDIKLKEIIQNYKYEALYLNLVNLIGSESINETPSLRVFRNRKNYRFKNKLHEQIFPSINAVNDSSVFISTDITLYHYGYDHNVIDMNKKIQRNINILSSYNDDEKDGLFYFSLGSEYLKVNDHINARDALLKAYSFPDDDGGYKIYLSVNLPKTCLTLKEYTTAIKYIDEFLKNYSDFRDIYFVKAACCFEVGKYSESFVYLNLYNKLPIKPHKYPSLNFEQSNDLNSLFSFLNANKIPHEGNLLATVIKAPNESISVIEAIKNINEISSYTFISYNHSTNIIDNNIRELGAELLDSFDDNSIIEYIKDSKPVKWVLLITPTTELSYNSKKQIIEAIESNDDSIISSLPYTLVRL